MSDDVAPGPSLHAAEEALRQRDAAYAAYAATLDASLDAMVGMDHRGLVTDFNAAAERLFGYRREEARGREMAELIIPPALRDAHRLGLARHLATGETRVLGRRIEIDALRSDGSTFPSELAIVRLPGEPPRFAGFLRDITDRRRTEEALRRLAEESAAARAEAETRATEAVQLAEQLQVQAAELEQQSDEAQVLAEELEQANAVLQRTLEQLRAVESITDAALSGHDFDAMLHELLRRLRKTLHTDTATVFVKSADGTELVVCAVDGLAAELGDRQPLPVGRGIAGTVAATGQPLAVDDIATMEPVDPVLRAHAHSVLAAPLTVGGRTIGVIHTGTATPRQWSSDALVLLGLVADRMAGAVDRSRLYEATRAELAERVRGESASQLLSTASTTLAASLDYETTLQAVARLAIPFLGDYCLVDLLEQVPDGEERLRRVASDHADPAHREAIRAAAGFSPDLSRAQHPTVRAVRGGHAVLVHADATVRAALARDAQHASVVARLRPNEILAVPLVARGRILGAMTFACGAERSFHPQDVATAEELGRRAGLAIDNALLYAEARAARERAERANRAKSLFLATMSHELRTPINANLGYGDLLDMELGGPLTAQQREYVTRSRAASRHLLELVNDVLDFSAIEAGQLTLARERQDLAAIARDAAALVAPQVAAGGLRLVNECAGTGIVVTGDERRLRQVLLNLLSNAVKFTSAGGTITVTCGTRAPSPDDPPAHGGPWATVRVVDTGSGIPPALRATLFDPFVQGQTGHTRTAGGTGLGLAISRHLARMMGGELALERSAPGEGSVFTLTLPVAEDQGR